MRDQKQLLKLSKIKRICLSKLCSKRDHPFNNLMRILQKNNKSNKRKVKMTTKLKKMIKPLMKL